MQHIFTKECQITFVSIIYIKKQTFMARKARYTYLLDFMEASDMRNIKKNKAG